MPGRRGAAEQARRLVGADRRWLGSPCYVMSGYSTKWEVEGLSSPSTLAEPEAQPLQDIDLPEPLKLAIETVNGAKLPLPLVWWGFFVWGRLSLSNFWIG